MNIALWVVQVLLALAFGMAGFMKTFTPLDQLAAQMSWVAEAPSWLPRFIGISEILGAIGLILPAVTRIKPILTPVAAAALGLVMVLAMGVHASYGEWGALGPNGVLLAMAAFVAWGRFTRAPIQERGARSMRAATA